MKIQMGDYISIEGLTVDQIRNAINKFEGAGFDPNYCVIPSRILKCTHLKWLGVDTESDIMALENFQLFGTDRSRVFWWSHNHATARHCRRNIISC